MTRGRRARVGRAVRLTLSGGAIIAMGAGLVGSARISAAEDGGPSRWGPNPADADPRAPQNNRHPGIHHDPDEIVACGKRFEEVYVDDNGLVTVTADPHTPDAEQCHVWTKEEIERHEELNRNADAQPRRDVRPVEP